MRCWPRRLSRSRAAPADGHAVRTAPFPFPPTTPCGPTAVCHRFWHRGCWFRARDSLKLASRDLARATSWTPRRRKCATVQSAVGIRRARGWWQMCCQSALRAQISRRPAPIVSSPLGPSLLRPLGPGPLLLGV